MSGVDIPQLLGALRRQIQQVDLAHVFRQLSVGLDEGLVVLGRWKGPGCVC
jgi:hypothetical protein